MPYPASSLLPPRSWTQRHEKKPTTTITITEDNKNEDHFFVSTDPRLLSVKAINAAFAKDFVYWGRPFPEEVMQQMLDGSLCFGVYRYNLNNNRHLSPHRNNNGQDDGDNGDDDNRETKIDVTTLHPQDVEQIGLSRVITDTVTFAYLTDVYVLPEYQSRGLGAWMMDCVAETLLPTRTTTTTVTTSDSNDNDGHNTYDMPYLRRIMLVTTNRAVDGGQREDYYAAKFGMKVVGVEKREDLDGMILSVMSANANAHKD